MPDPFTIALRYAWVGLIAGTMVIAIYYWIRSLPYIARDPSLKDGYRKVIVGILVWGNIPWIIMGLGCTVAGIPSVFDFYRPRDGNPFVLAFFASLFLIWVLGTWWIFARGGAEMLIRHPGWFSHELRNPTIVKLLWCLMLAGSLVATIAMFVTP